MTLYIIIYILGYIAAYYMLRHLITFDDNDKDWYSWRFVIINMLYSLFSWLCFIATLIVFIVAVAKEKSFKSKPPKWL